MATALAPKGLEGIVATTSSICWIDGDAGVLSYRGIDIHELADHSTFEETTFLLWNGKLPSHDELKSFSHSLAEARNLPAPVLDFLRTVPKAASPMEVLRTAVSPPLHLATWTKSSPPTRPTSARPSASPPRSP